MKITMQDPVVVATSVAGETRWGFHQFPALNRMPDGGVLLMYADAADASETHGAPAPCHVSYDDGASWRAPAPGDLGGLRPTRPHFSISRLFDGEWLCIPAQPYLNVREQGIALPPPDAVGDTYGRCYSYRIASLPEEVQAYFRHLPAQRLRAHGAAWEDDMAECDTEDRVAWRRDGSDVLPRTFFERSILPFQGELFYADYRGRYTRPDGTVGKKGSTSLLVSTDNGRSFRRRATVAWDPADNDLMGEPSLAATADGRLVCVIRRTDQNQKPMAIAWSSDRGHTWTPPRSLFEFGVWPCALLLGNGVLALSYGRPGVHLAFDPAGTGERWPVQTPVIAGDPAAILRHSCGYTSLLAMGDDAFLLAYSDFQHRNAQGEPCKAILVRRVIVRK